MKLERLFLKLIHFYKRTGYRKPYFIAEAEWISIRDDLLTRYYARVWPEQELKNRFEIAGFQVSPIPLR